MTKEDLKQLLDIRDELSALSSQIEGAEAECLQYTEDRRRFAETVMMSSTDEACRVVESRVISQATTPEEARAKRGLKQLREQRAELCIKLDSLLPEAEAWILTLKDWRVRRILLARYIHGITIRDTAEQLHFSEGHVMNVESRFWAKNGK